MDVGDPVLLRSIYRGVVRWCWPHRFVGEWAGRLGIYVQPGSQGKLIEPPPGASYLDRWVTDAPPFDHVWEQTHVLRFMRPGDRHTVDVWGEPDGEWRWKDEDDLERAVELGVFDAAGAAAVRAKGERVIAEAPWPTGWEGWRPPAGWKPLGLPADWRVLHSSATP